MREALALTRVDILLNAAGLQRRSPAQDLSYEAYEEVMDANLSAIKASCYMSCREKILSSMGVGWQDEADWSPRQ